MATGAAAIIAKARRNIQHDFFGQDAVRPDRAIPFDAQRRVERRVFDRWRRAGVIREEPGGRYWLDVVAYDRDLRQRHNRLRVALLLIVVLLLTGMVTGLLTVNRP